MKSFQKNSLVVLVVISFLGSNAPAFIANSFYAGIGYQSQNVMNKITQSATGSKSTFGTPVYPLVLKYDRHVTKDWFFAPKLTYTLINRSAEAGSAKVTEWHLMFPVGMNISSGPWDWSLGPGLFNSKIEGPGGIVSLNNGSGTSQFALPGGSSESRLVSFNFASNYRLGNHNIGFDLLTTGTLSNKRTLHFMLSYLYQFSGGRK